MNEQRKHTLETGSETATREPLFRRYQIKVKAGLRVGPVPTGGEWPVGF
jgi:hypothetical protein